MTWETKAIGDVLNVKSSKRIFASEYADTGIPFYRSKEIGELSKRENTKSDLFISKDRYDEIKTKFDVPKKGDLLLTSVGSIGNTWIVDDREFYYKDGNITQLECVDDISMKFIQYYFKTNLFWSSIKSNATGTAYSALTITNIKKLKIPIPPLPVQQKIATILDTADALKQKDKALIAKYDELTQSLFLDMFGDPITNPKGFLKMKLADFCEFENGDRSSNYPSKGDIIKQGKLFLSSGDIIEGKFIVKDSKFISEEKYNSLSRGKCRKGDVLMTLRGNGVGRSGVFDCKFQEGFINAQMVILRPNSKCLNNYLVFQLNSPQIFKRLLKISSGSAQPQLAAGNVKLFEVLIPPIELQNQFADRIQAIEQQKQQAQASLQKSEDLFNCLLQKAFKGELVS